MGLQPGVPTQTFTRVGVQAIALYPWNDTTGPYNNTTVENLYGLASIDQSINAKSAILKGGESVFSLGAWETDREIKIKVMARKTSERVFAILLGGTFEYNPSNAYGREEQYYTSSLGDRAPYFRLLAQGINGDGTTYLTYPKLRVDGNIQWNWERDSVTDLEFEATVVYDYTYVNLIGQVGAPYEFFWTQGNESTPHS